MPETDPPVTDWAAIERSPEFRELVHDRRRFAAVAGILGLGFGLLYVILAHVADSAMEAKAIGGMSVGFLFGVVVILVTWAVTGLYMRRSQRVWGPMEETVRELAQGAAR